MELTPMGLAYCARHGRPAIERRIERHLALVTALLAIIDDADGDFDIEDGDDPDLEPSIGGNVLNFEAIDTELDTSDTEPSLGWTEMEGRYGNRGMAPTFDPDCEVDDADDEPNLGAPEPGFAPPLYGMWRGQLPYLPAMPLEGQGAWGRGRGDDDEQVNEDGDDLDTREADGLETGEADPAEGDSGLMIHGGNELGVGEISKRAKGRLAASGWRL